MLEIEAGRVLSDRYRLVRPVGQGSQASVWVADHLALNTQVAVKLIDPDLAKKEDARERFRREATAAAQLRSAHVVQILDHGIDGDQPFIVMELLEGEDLFERLVRRLRLTPKETSKIVTHVARALVRAHAAGIVHRDLKPENVFLVPNEDDEVAKVLDFGVAKIIDPAKTTMQRTGIGTLIGTPHYMSPEQVKGIGEVDYRTDLWALGVMTYQCMTGQLPFDSEGVGDLLIRITIGEAPVPSKVFSNVPKGFDEWFATACNRDPAKRFESARDLADALARVVGLGPIDDTGRHRFGPPSRPRPSERPQPVSSRPRERVQTEPLPLVKRSEAAKAAGAGAAAVRSGSSPSKSDPPRAGSPPRPAQPAAKADAAAAAPPAPAAAAASLTDAVTRAADAAPQAAAQSSESAKATTTEGRDTTEIEVVVDPTLTPAPPAPPPSQADARAAAQQDRAVEAAVEAARLRLHSTVTGLESSGPSVTPPPELDGSRRKRLVGYLAFVIAAAAIAVTVTVVRSRWDSTTNDDANNAASVPPPPAVDVSPPDVHSLPAATPSPSDSAVNPGKSLPPGRPSTAPGVARPLRPRTAPKSSAGGHTKPNGEPVIEIPEPDEPPK